MKESPESATLKAPYSPSNTGAGPVMPRQASRAEKRPFLEEWAAAHPFHMLSSPALVCLSDQLVVTAMFIACSSLSTSRPRTLPAPTAEAMAMYTT